MDAVILIARLLLAAVFATAGLAKLADRAGSKRAVSDFGVPALLSAPLAVALPVAELAVAASLIPASTAWWGAWGALGLLVLFIGAIGYNLARGRTPDCHCFGQLHSSPAGWSTILRNGILTAIAALILWQGRDGAGTSVVTWLGGLTMAELLGGIGAVVVLLLFFACGAMILNLLRQNGRLLLRIEALEAAVGIEGDTPTAAEPEAGLPIGSPAPPFSLTGLHSETLTLDFLRASGRPVLAIFSDPGCGPCTALLPEVARWQREFAGQVTIALISQGTREANLAKTAEHGLTNVLLQSDREVAQAYGAEGTPSAVIVQPDGTIGSALAAGAEGIRALLTATVGSLPTPLPAPIPAPAPSGNGNAAAIEIRRKGDAAPPVELPDLSGRVVKLSQFRGKSTLVLFWNPGCGFCQKMLEDLKRWEANPPKGAPKLVVVSTGSADDNRRLGFRAPVLLDQGFVTASQFGANGTPMAVLLDPKGRIVSDVAAGAQQVMALAGDGAG